MAQPSLAQVPSVPGSSTSTRVVAEQNMGQTRGRDESALTPDGTQRAKASRPTFDSPIKQAGSKAASMGLKQHIDTLRENVHHAFVNVNTQRTAMEARMIALEGRLAVVEIAQIDANRGMDTLLNDLPNRFAAADATKTLKMRLDVAVNNHESNVASLKQLERMLDEWST